MELFSSVKITKSGSFTNCYLIQPPLNSKGIFLLLSVYFELYCVWDCPGFLENQVHYYFYPLFKCYCVDYIFIEKSQDKHLIFFYKSGEFNMYFRAKDSSVFSCIDAILQVKRRHNILYIIYYPQTQDQGFLAVGARVQCGLRVSHGCCRTAGEGLCWSLSSSWDSSFNVAT